MDFLMGKLLRRRCIRRRRSHVDTGITPLKAIRSVTLLIDFTSPTRDGDIFTFDKFCSEHNLKGIILCFDFRTKKEQKLSAEDKINTNSNLELIYRKDRNCFNKIRNRKMKKLIESGFMESELIISLSEISKRSEHFPARYLIACSNARFKIGVSNSKSEETDKTKNRLLNIIIHGNSAHNKSVSAELNEIIHLLKSIQ